MDHDGTTDEARGSIESSREANDKLHYGKARRQKKTGVPVLRVGVANVRGGLFRDKSK